MTRLGMLAALGVVAGLLTACTAGGAPASTPTPSAPHATASDEPDVDTPDEDEPDPSQSTAPPSASPPAGTAAPAGVSGSWTGAWRNDPQWGDAAGGFTMTVQQDGNAFTGTIDVTGPTCVGQGTVSGTVTGRHVTMGLVVGTVRDVSYDGTLDGNSMSGTWTTIACNVTQEVSGTWSAQR